MIKDKGVAIHPSGTPKDLAACERGEKSSKGMRATPKGYGSRKCVGVIRDGEYVDPETGEPITVGEASLDLGKTININVIGGIE